MVGTIITIVVKTYEICKRKDETPDYGCVMDWEKDTALGLAGLFLLIYFIQILLLGYQFKQQARELRKQKIINNNYQTFAQAFNDSEQKDLAS